MAFSISPSRVARYFYHDCERYLRYHATPTSQRAGQGVPATAQTGSPVTAAILARGYQWEEEVVRSRLRGRVRVARGTGALHERTHGVAQTLKLLGNLADGEYLYQPTLRVPDAFLQRYGLDLALCQFPECRPDLLYLEEDFEGPRTLWVIDIKASDALKTSHRIQTALYALILRDVLSEAGLADIQVDLSEAGIWLFGADRPEWFDLATTLPLVEGFLGESLTGILSRPVDEVPWHLFFRCEWCEFYSHCQDEAEQTRSVSLLPYLSVGGRRHLRELGTASVHTLDQFEELLSGDDETVSELLDTCGNLRNRLQRLRNGVQSLQTGQVVSHGGSSLAMPVGEHVRMVFTLQNDPHSGQIYAAGLYRPTGQVVYGEKPLMLREVAADPADCARVCRDFLRTLHEQLRILHDFNEGKDWGEQKSLQIYAFDSYELTLLNRLLLEALEDPELAPLALPMLFFFQDEQLALQDTHPESEVAFPVVVLTGVIRQLVALPEPLVLRLPEVLRALPNPNFNYNGLRQPGELFWFELSNTMKSDVLFQLWNGKAEAHAWIQGELGRRLYAASNVVDGLREVVGRQLFAWPPKFALPGVRSFRHPEFSRLHFIARYESFMGALERRTQRTRPWSERVREGISIPLKCRGGSRWQLLEFLDESQVEASDFPSWLIVPEGEQGERDQMGHDDYARRATHWLPRNRNLWLAAVEGVELIKGTSRVSGLGLRIKGNAGFRPGDRAVLHPRFTDWTVDRIAGTLIALDQLPDPDNELLTLIRKPVAFCQPARTSRRLVLALHALEASGFTPSQRRAFQQLRQRRLTLVWGPPGTGKTYFLARAVLCMAEAHGRFDRVFRIGLTAFTHAAIENLLLKIDELLSGFRHVPAIYKLGDCQTARAQRLASIDPTDVEDYNDQSVILGGTVHGFWKARDRGNLESVDLLIVDEASQMKFGDFSLAMESLRPGTGRLVLAGDDLQLPPIIKGEYPAPPDGLPGLHDSVFAYLRARDSEKQPFTRQLTENWRMNRTLSAFPARTLYSKSYRPANQEIARRRLDLSPPGRRRQTHDALLDWLLDPDYPLVLAVLEGVQATTANSREAELVADLSVALRSCLKQDNGRRYLDNEADDTRFWREGLFIVSPHHDQIHAIQAALQSRRTWHAAPFVDTVDKMQGQESRAVIVSYGVSDTETALQEAEFIYSLNRLNVAITRAQAKCVVFLPGPLLEPSFELLSNDRALRGLTFMRQLLDFCGGGERREFSLARGSLMGRRIRLKRT